MSTYKSFAVVGGGLVGLPVVTALAAKKVSVVLLSRPESSAKDVPPGVQVEKVDYNNVAATAAVLRKHKVDVVLSTVATAAAGTLTSLVDAAKLAEIKLFVPSEYGLPTDAQTEGALGDKNKLAAYLKDVGVPSTRIFTGMFIEFIPWISGYTDNGKITIVGNGEAPLSCTAVEDIAGFVAHVLTTLPPSGLENRIFRLQGDRATLNDLGPLFKTTTEYVDQVTGESGELKTYLMKLIDTGLGSTGWDAVHKVERSGGDAAGSGNAFWPGHQWKTIKDVHNL